MLPTYRLDDLGWFAFERIAQAVLRAKLGSALEAWGGGQDFGCDAYSEGKLSYPDTQVLSEGPFIFQVKFVSGANATGARWESALKTAINAEIGRINKRILDRTWSQPSFYTLMTNAPVSAKERKRFGSLLKKVMPNALIIIHGATDISVDLDIYPVIRTAYPQLLGLRDLKELIAASVNADVLRRSTLGVERALDLAKVYVPAETYNQTIRLLRANRFAVLTGPPEMGKTATAWMVALGRLSLGWEAFDCRKPEDVLRMYDKRTHQVFIADDAFGSTEYRPEIASEWAAQLDRVLQVRDEYHWILWTSRPGPLRVGLERLHMQGVSETFPAPNDVQVDASSLTVAEKAQMLYRHAKNANLTDGGKGFVRRHAEQIVCSRYFTPFRIHRFVIDQLPRILNRPEDEQGHLVSEAVSQSLEQPSQYMRTSFDTLPYDVRATLIAMLGAGAGMRTIEDITALRYSFLEGDADVSTEAALHLIDDHFVKVTHMNA